jgi:predicted PolB exonuclease-like 3'-5' exonuclease/predicted RNA-binding Zn-ribbon protein involved in translation (DUF1610 family)
VNEPKNKPRIVCFDIETVPDLLAARHVWPGLSNYPGLTFRGSINSVACFGWKVLDVGKRAECLNAWDFKAWKVNINDDRELMESVYEILKDANAVITQNGKRFDLPFIQTRLAKWKLPLLPEIKHIDTKLLMKKLSLFSNSLKYGGEFLTEERKMENEGWQLWEDVCDKKPEAMKKMTTYCKQDVVTTEALFKRLIPFAKDLPNYNLFRNDAIECCPNCGSFEIKRDGIRVAKTKTFQRFRCGDCGTVSQGETQRKLPKGTLRIS